MIFPCFEPMLAMIKKNEHAPYFIPGEGELAEMTVQLKKMGFKADKKNIQGRWNYTLSRTRRSRSPCFRNSRCFWS